MLTVSILLMVGTINGIGPESSSNEIVQGLDLSGEWEGYWWFENSEPFPTELRDHMIVACDGREIRFLDISSITDEGGGKLRVQWYWSADGWAHGIYRQDGDRLYMCFRDRPGPRPTSFRSGNGCHVLFLRRLRQVPKR